jgi:hypothetical protein
MGTPCRYADVSCPPRFSLGGGSAALVFPNRCCRGRSPISDNFIGGAPAPARPRPRPRSAPAAPLLRPGDTPSRPGRLSCWAPVAPNADCRVRQEGRQRNDARDVRGDAEERVPGDAFHLLQLLLCHCRPRCSRAGEVGARTYAQV